MEGIRNVILDTSALLEWLTNSKKADAVDRYWQDVNFSVMVPSLVIAELTSVLKRKGIETESIRRKIMNSCIILELGGEIAGRAGELHAEIRKKDTSISLADCVIMAHGERENALIVSTDAHFKRYENADII